MDAITYFRLPETRARLSQVIDDTLEKPHPTSKKFSIATALSKENARPEKAIAVKEEMEKGRGSAIATLTFVRSFFTKRSSKSVVAYSARSGSLRGQPIVLDASWTATDASTGRNRRDQSPVLRRIRTRLLYQGSRPTARQTVHAGG